MLKMMMTDAMPEVADPAAKDKVEADDPCQVHGKSRLGPRRALAIAIACPLRIHKAYTALKIPPLKGQLIG